MPSKRFLLVLFFSLFLSCPIHALTRQEALSWVREQEGCGLDLDGRYGAQCSDLVSAYLNYLSCGDMHALYFGVYDACAYEKVLRLCPASFLILSPDVNALPGDIFVSKGADAHGHTGIILSPAGAGALILDQNSTPCGPLGGAFLHTTLWEGNYELRALIRFRGFSEEGEAKEIERTETEKTEAENKADHAEKARNEAEITVLPEDATTPGAADAMVSDACMEGEAAKECLSLRLLSCHKGRLELGIYKASPQGGTQILVRKRGEGLILTRRTKKESLTLSLPRGESYELAWRFYQKKGGTFYYTPMQGRLLVKVP